MTESTGTQKRSTTLLRWVGYGLLVLALFNTIALFIPTRLMNPMWELMTLSALVEQVFIPLLGLVLVFYGQANYRSDREIPLLKGLSWIRLLIGVLFALLVPLGINNTVQLYSLAQKQASAQVNQRVSQIQEFKTQLNQAEGKELESLFKRIKPTGASAPVSNPSELNNLKLRFLSEINKAEETLKHQELFQTPEGMTLLKSSIKSNLGALVCGILFVRIWQITRWARRLG